jgi:hypothetical protein
MTCGWAHVRVTALDRLTEGHVQLVSEESVGGRPSRRPRLASPRAWFLSRPQVQAVVDHPKVQWTMTHFGIRRWLTIRRWPALFLASAFGRPILDPIHGPRWQQDTVIAASGLACFATALTVDACLTRRARRLVGLRSRPAYLAMAAAPLSLAIVGLYLSIRLYAHHVWLSDVFTLVGTLSGWTGLLALGRALTWGRLRHLCWVYPPAGQPSWHTRQDDSCDDFADDLGKHAPLVPVGDLRSPPLMAR